MYVFNIIVTAISDYSLKQHYLSARCNSGIIYCQWSGNYFFFPMAQ